jgi:hypothetical protein
MLDLYFNEVGVEGAQHLADALQINAVRSFFYPFIIIYESFSFNTGTYNTDSCRQQNRQ